MEGWLKKSVKERIKGMPMRLTPGIIKFQRAVKKLIPEKKSIQYFVKQYLLRDKLRRRTRT